MDRFTCGWCFPSFVSGDVHATCQCPRVTNCPSLSKSNQCILLRDCQAMETEMNHWTLLHEINKKTKYADPVIQQDLISLVDLFSIPALISNAQTAFASQPTTCVYVHMLNIYIYIYIYIFVYIYIYIHIPQVAGS